MKEFEKWWEEKLNMHWSHYDKGVCKLAWKAALEWVSKLCPTNEKASFANQGQGMDGYTELANYKVMYKKLKEELDGKT